MNPQCGRRDLVALMAALCLTSLLPTASTDAQQPVRGVRFCLDTLEIPVTWRGPLTPVGGRVEFADGRGRLELVSTRHDPLTVVNGIELAPPAGRPGDYYLFNDSALVLVQPRTRTYAQLRLSRVLSNGTSALLPGDELFRYTINRIDTVSRGKAPRGQRRVPLKIQMHVDIVHGVDVSTSLARAAISLNDAPPGEASVLRWLGAARILADISPKIHLERGETLQLTAVVALRPTPDGRPDALLTSGHPISCVASADIDRTRLVIPRGYRGIPWPQSRAYR